MRKISLAPAVLWGASHALQLTVVPLIPPLVTNVNLAHYDLSGTGAGTSIYVLHLQSTPADSAVGAVRVRYRILVENADENTGPRTVYEGRSNTFRIDSRTPPLVSITSKQFMIKENPAVLFSRYRSVDWKAEDPFRDALMMRTLQAGSLVSGNLRYEFFLEVSNQTNPSNNSASWNVTAEPYIEAQIVNINSMNPITPGLQAGTGSLEIPTPFPEFRWVSDLYPGIYGSNDVFELAVYRQRPGRTLRENLSNPIHTTRTRNAQYTYPTSAVPLQPGETYLWQVKGLLKGAVDDRIESPVFAFRVRSNQISDPRVQQYMQRLRTLLVGTPWEGLMAQLEGYDAGMRIVLNGVEVPLESLEPFLQQVMSGGVSLENMRIR